MQLNGSDEGLPATRCDLRPGDGYRFGAIHHPAGGQGLWRLNESLDRGLALGSESREWLPMNDCIKGWASVCVGSVAGAALRATSFSAIEALMPQPVDAAMVHPQCQMVGSGPDSGPH